MGSKTEWLERLYFHRCINYLGVLKIPAFQKADIQDPWTTWRVRGTDLPCSSKSRYCLPCPQNQGTDKWLTQRQEAATVWIESGLKDFPLAQWIRILLQCKGHVFDPLSGKIPWQIGTTGHSCHNYWAHRPQYWSFIILEVVLCNQRSPGNEKPTHFQPREALTCCGQKNPHAATKTQHSRE